MNARKLIAVIAAMVVAVTAAAMVNVVEPQSVDAAEGYVPDGWLVYVKGTNSPDEPIGLKGLWMAPRDCERGGDFVEDCEVQLTSDPTDRNPEWSPTGMEVAFSRADANGNRDIYAVTVDGAVRSLTNGGASGDANTFWSFDDPAWSPDGTSLVVEAGADLAVVPGAVYVPPEYCQWKVRRDPSWSSTGELAWTLDALGGVRIDCPPPDWDGPTVWTGTLSGGTMLTVPDDPDSNALSNEAVGYSHPDWSSDGTRIAVTAHIATQASWSHGRHIINVDVSDGEAHHLGAGGFGIYNGGVGTAYAARAAWDPAGDFIAMSGVDMTTPTSEWFKLEGEISYGPSGQQVDVQCDVSTCIYGTVIIEKHVDPIGSPPEASPATFTYTGDVAASLEWLNDPFDPTPPRATAVVDQATVGVTETFSEWELIGLECDDTDSTGDLATRTATIHLDRGEIVTCVFSSLWGGGIDPTDSDGDGIPDHSDECPGFDDNVDSDGDGIPDGCDGPDSGAFCGELGLEAYKVEYNLQAELFGVIDAFQVETFTVWCSDGISVWLPDNRYVLGAFEQQNLFWSTLFEGLGFTTRFERNDPAEEFFASNSGTAASAVFKPGAFQACFSPFELISGLVGAKAASKVLDKAVRGAARQFVRAALARTDDAEYVLAQFISSFKAGDLVTDLTKFVRGRIGPKLAVRLERIGVDKNRAALFVEAAVVDPFEEYALKFASGWDVLADLGSQGTAELLALIERYDGVKITGKVRNEAEAGVLAIIDRYIVPSFTAPLFDDLCPVLWEPTVFIDFSPTAEPSGRFEGFENPALSISVRG